MTRSQCARVLGTALALGVSAESLWWAAGSPAAAVDALRAPGADFDSLLAAVTGALAWLGLAWFVAVLALHAVALAPSATGSLCRRIVDHTAPRFMRVTAGWLVGVTVLAGPLAPGVAGAVPIGSGPARPAATASSLSAGQPLSLDRPAPPYPARRPVAAPSVATPAATARATDGTLLTGVAHRDVADHAYVIQRGDTLWQIAARHLGPRATAADIAREWPRWYAANHAAIGNNPQLIHPGLVLHRPLS